MSRQTKLPVRFVHLMFKIQKRMQKDVIIQLQDEDESIKARVVLRSEDYGKAGLAYLRNIPIQVLGTLQRQARNYQLIFDQRFNVSGIADGRFDAKNRHINSGISEKT